MRIVTKPDPGKAEGVSMEFYVSVIDGERYALLLGSYRTHGEVKAQVSRGQDLACKSDRFAIFYAFGTYSLPRGMRAKTLFGQ